MESKKLKFINAEQKEAEGLYREVYQDYSSFKQHVQDFKRSIEVGSSQIETIEKVLDILDDVKDEDVVKFKTNYRDAIDKSYDEMEKSREYLEMLEEKEERADKFMEMFKDEFDIDENTQKTTLGFGALMLIEYFNTIQKMVQQEEKENKKG